MAEEKKMKAWLARNDEGYAVVCFAETAGKAKAFLQWEDEFDGYPFVDIKVCRASIADKMYRGLPRMDWDNEEDRIFLVDKLGFYCLERAYVDCKGCCAREYCCFGQED